MHWMRILLHGRLRKKIKAQGGEFILTNAPVALRMGKLNDLAKKQTL